MSGKVEEGRKGIEALTPIRRKYRVSHFTVELSLIVLVVCSKKKEPRMFYCPALATAVVIASGRLSSSVSSVPAISVAERCLLSQ